MRRLPLLGVALLLAVVPHTAAFNGHRVTAGPLTLTVEPVSTVTAHDQPADVAVTLASRAGVPLAVRLELTGLIDDCRAVGAPRQTVTVPANGRATARFQVLFPDGCHSALYPVHIKATFDDGGKAATAHAIQIVTTEFPDSGRAVKEPAGPVAVPRRGAVALATVKRPVVHWAYLNGKERAMPPGWQGREPESSASFGWGRVARGETRAALHMHPPYVPGPGTVSVEYTVRLPDTRPLRLTFHTAIRDHAEKEPPSDGVTFRVWADGRKLFERHSAAKTWTPGEVDLTPLAGRTVRLRLECHPGPKNDTTCDSAYWGDPTITAGPTPRVLTAAESAALVERARVAVATGVATGPDLLVFPLADGARAALALGAAGLFDGALAFGTGERQVCFSGLRASVNDQPAGRWPAPLFCDGFTVSREAGGQVRLTHRLRSGDETVDLTAIARADGPGLRLAITCPRPITDLSVGPADRTARRVFFGHGYCVTEPRAFHMGAGGHGLAAGHVAFEFADGPALLVASDTTPEHLHVDPAARLYALHTHPDATFTFVPAASGIDAGLRYRDLDPRTPPATFARMAGRFVFDIWGGKYTENATMVRRAAAYGLTDALYILHVWQRWGYDYRLPDIFPPDPGLGTLANMQALAKQCRDHKIPFALHDNYIDFYPDADEYSYEHITFDAAGHPRKAWLNEYRRAQSYQFRPDHILPFVRRNLRPIAEQVRPTAYFVDVFASMPPFDYHDRKGQPHSRSETVRYWGDAFDLIRKELGGDAPMISEAGGDYLIGHLDGCDCQLLHLADRPARFTHRLPCKSWAIVPWLDLVHHHRFSLHGVGYSDRYQGERKRADHGIESDDYLSAEVLTGHAPMIDRPAMLRGAVRKYWLIQSIARAVAGDRIASVTFVDDDPQRLVIGWKSGVRVWVNRGDADWTVEGRTLAPFGFLARAGETEASVERIGGQVVERSRGKAGQYVNGRGAVTDFGALATSGGVRCQTAGDTITLTPLPDGGPVGLRLRAGRLLGRTVQVIAVEAVDEAGKVTRPVPFTGDGTTLEVTLPKGDFACRVRVR